MKHLISALVENKPGVLAHVAGMFAARAFNIDSLVVGRTEDPALSRMTIVVVGDDRVVEQVRKQLAKIVPVVKVQDFAGQPVVARDLMLVAVSAPPEKRHEVLSLIETFKGKVVDIGPKFVMV
ncbi:MAG: acetolactate synthase small subunit, partial [Planctomycetota bacterium]